MDRWVQSNDSEYKIAIGLVVCCTGLPGIKTNGVVINVRVATRVKVNVARNGILR